MGTIYGHRSKITGKWYVGQTVASTKKVNQNRWRNGEGYKGQNKFYNAIQNEGWDNFEHIILEEDIPRVCLNEREQYYINKYDSYKNGYNSNSGGSGIYGSVQSWEEEFIKNNYIRLKAVGCSKAINRIWDTLPVPRYKKSPRAISYIARRMDCQIDYSLIVIETGIIYGSPTDFKNAYNLKSTGNVCTACLGHKETLAGVHLAYTWDTERINSLQQFKGQLPNNAFYRTRHIKVFCAEDNIIYDSISAMQKIGLANRAMTVSLSKGKHYFKGKHYAFVDDAAGMEMIKQYIGKQPEVAIMAKRKAIYCLELDEEFSGIKVAEHKLSITCISAALQNSNRCIDGYHWCYIEDKEKLKQQYPLFIGTGLKQNNVTIKVHCLELNLLFNSAKEAEHYTGINAGCIIGCCKHRKNCYTAGGYHWRYANETEKSLSGYSGKLLIPVKSKTNIDYASWEKDYISLNYKVYGAKACREYINSQWKALGHNVIRSLNSIKRMAKSLGAQPKVTPWTAEQEAILFTYARTETTEQLHRRIPDKKPGAIKAHCLKLGIYKDPAWTEAEEEILKKFYPIEGRAIFSRFPDKKPNTVYKHASDLGLKAPGYRTIWDSKDDIIFREKYQELTLDEFCKLFPDRTRQSIKSRAITLGVANKRQAKFTDEENNIIITFYKTEPQKVFELISYKTESSIRKQASNLGVTKNKLRRVRNKTTGEIFESLVATGLNGIGQAIKNNKAVNGDYWEYVDKEK